MEAVQVSVKQIPLSAFPNKFVNEKKMLKKSVIDPLAAKAVICVEVDKAMPYLCCMWLLVVTRAKR